MQIFPGSLFRFRTVLFGKTSLRGPPCGPCHVEKLHPSFFLQDFEMETLNDLFTQWLPVTLLITGTIDKRAPQPHINDLRACGFTNGLVLLFLYLGTFLFPGRFFGRWPIW